MAQDVAAENVHLQQEGGAEDVNSPLRDILEREDENDRKPENNLANQLLRALGENDALECCKLLERNHAMVRLNTKTSEMTARKPTRKSGRGKGDFGATVGIAARKCLTFVPTSANLVVVRTLRKSLTTSNKAPNRKDQKLRA